MEEKGGYASGQEQKGISETEQIVSELATVVDPITRVFANIHLGEITEELKRIRSEMTSGQLEETKRLALQYRRKYQLAKFKDKLLPSKDDNLYMTEIFNE